MQIFVGTSSFEHNFNIVLVLSQIRWILFEVYHRTSGSKGVFRERFGLSYHLDFYEAEDLTKIVARSAYLLHVDIDPEASREIARRARG
jgi:Holliday junction resolvasome RuvABC ATP-dependent DNA helicase subunit